MKSINTVNKMGFEEVLNGYLNGEFPVFYQITPWYDAREGLINKYVDNTGTPIFNYDLYGWVLLNEPINKINQFINYYRNNKVPGMEYFQPNTVMGICSCLIESCGGSEHSCLPISKFLEEHNKLDILPLLYLDNIV